jgi:hypothetical protein
LMALANHGGGFLVLGFLEGSSGSRPAPNRPPTLDPYSQDLINAIVRNYAEPAFHCSVHHVPHPTSGIHPVIGVTGGHRVPIRAKRAGPNNQIVQQHTVYIRRPGPRSEQPLDGREWDELFTRCLDARRDELLERIRDLLTGRPTPEATIDRAARLDDWIKDCERIWRDKIAALPPADSPSRCPHGFFIFAYQLDRVTPPSLADLRHLLRNAPQFTGWPPWWVPSRHEIAPYVSEGAIECWIGGDTSEHQDNRDAAHSDFWRVSPDGSAFLLRGYQEDGRYGEASKTPPGTTLDPTVLVWRAAEGLLHAEYLSRHLGAGSVSFAARYFGLKGRRFAQWTNTMDYSWAAGVSKDDSVSVSTTAAVEALSGNLVEVVQLLLSPLYERFDFSQLPVEIVQRELNRMRSRV